MPLTVSFTTSQSYGSPNEVTFTDGTTGSDPAVVARRIYLRKADGTYLVVTGTTTNYEPWLNFPGTTTITLDLLDKDYAVLAWVEWVDGSGNALYTSTPVGIGFTLYNETFDYGLTQRLSGNQLLTNDNNFLSNKFLLRQYIDSGNQAISFPTPEDLFAAQVAYDKATELRINASQYFNAVAA